jgi:hypothetical protein|tara:strand:- start:145 stop:255 length:111 start_codon:yes stop_codon:yes gene_type:complete
MKYIKWILELVNELADGLTSSGYTEILPENKKDIEQ